MNQSKQVKILKNNGKVLPCSVVAAGRVNNPGTVIIAQPKRNLNTSHLPLQLTQTSLTFVNKPSFSLRHPQLQHPHSQFASFLFLERSSLHLSRWLTRYVMSSVGCANSRAVPCHSISCLPCSMIRPNADHSLHYSVRGMPIYTNNILRACVDSPYSKTF